MTDKLEIHIIQLPKAIKEYKESKENKESKFLQWMMFLNEPECVEVDEIMKENREIKEAKVTLRELSQDEENQRIAELREKHILDTQDIYETGLNEGLKKGEKLGRKIGQERGEKIGQERGEKIGQERGEKIGQERGEKIGQEKGEKIGKIEEKRKIAKKLLAKKMPIEQIMEITELTKEEILKIQKEIN